MLEGMNGDVGWRGSIKGHPTLTEKSCLRESVGGPRRQWFDLTTCPITYLHEILFFFLSGANSLSDGFQFGENGFGFTEFIAALASGHFFINSVQRGKTGRKKKSQRMAEYK